MNQLHDFLPYILEHRGRTFVCVMSPQLLTKKRALEHIVAQLCTLHSLGVRLILVVQTHPGITHVSAELGARIATKNARMRMELERLFSVSTPRSHRGSYPVCLVSGNFATARPQGVLDGVDTELAGAVRSIDTGAIKRLLDADAIVLLTSSLYSALGDAAFVVDWQQVVESLVQQMSVDKVIVLHADKQLSADNDTLSLDDMVHYRHANNPLMRSAQTIAHSGVARVHLLYGLHKHALVQEVLSQHGKGILVGRTAFERIERASQEDLGALLALIRPYEQSGMLTVRQRATLEEHLPYHYYLLKRDQAVIASGALVPYRQAHIAEIACLAVSRNAHGAGLGSHMLRHLEQQASIQGFTQVFCLTTQAAHWFMERGYVDASASILPPTRAQNERNSRVLMKKLS